MYIEFFVLLAIFCFSVQFLHGLFQKDRSQGFTPAFYSFRNNYIFIYCLMMAGDWLQGPYVYALYESYGFDVAQIGILFIAGFGSSLVFGTAVGSLADRMGRKKACLLYCLTYSLSCVTKHWNDFSVLIIGRLLGGIATSLLFCAFESWLVAEHKKNKFDDSWLGHTFSKAVFFGNGLTAILAGVAGNYLVRNLELGPVAPFDAAILLLALGGTLIFFLWGENYGSQSEDCSLFSQFAEAFHVIRKDSRVLALGCMQGLFEGAMYTFVFLWTPTLSKFENDIPHGFIFSNFMLSSMVGSALAGLMIAVSIRPEAYMCFVFAVGALSLAVVVSVFYFEQTDMGGFICFTSFCVFEIVVGLFWPSMMTMRGEYVPEKVRSTVISIFRMPLNLFVCAILGNVTDENLGMVFSMCVLFLTIACGFQIHLYLLTQNPPNRKTVYEQ